MKKIYKKFLKKMNLTIKLIGYQTLTENENDQKRTHLFLCNPLVTDKKLGKKKKKGIVDKKMAEKIG